MTTKPDDLPQKAILVGLDSSAIPSDVVMVNGYPYYSNVYASRAILKAKNDAYEEACAEVRKLRLQTALDGGMVENPYIDVYKVSQAIRNLKHETEV